MLFPFFFVMATEEYRATVLIDHMTDEDGVFASSDNQK